MRYPNCSNCENALVPCLTYHSGKQAEIPRNYVSNLEAQVEKLAKELQELRTHPQTHAQRVSQGPPSSTDPTSPAAGLTPFSSGRPEAPDENPAESSYIQDVVKSVTTVVNEPSRQPRFLGQSSAITLARLVMAAIRTDKLPSSPLSSDQSSYEPVAPALAVETSLPPRNAANQLVDVYFQYRTPHMPIIGRPQVEEALESAYRSMGGQQPLDRFVEKDIFTTYMVFAIALCDITDPSGRGRPVQNESCFRSALGWIERVLTYSKSDLETLRTILLIVQFVTLCPSSGSLWHLTGTALRLCIDIGLHWETEEQTLRMDPDLLHERRRLWYITYQFDRVLSITLGRPFGITDESMRVPLPNPWTSSRRGPGRELHEFDIHNQRCHNHLFTLSKLESEVKHVLNSQSWALKIANPKVNYSAWIQDIQPRLQEWYSTVPQIKEAHPSSIFASQAYWDGIYNNAILLLYRPHSSVLHTSQEALLIFFEASCKVISSLKTLQREGKVEVLWKGVHHLFMAGLGVIYCLWHSKEIRDRNPIRISISTLQSCASTLSAMSETFPGASGCRDVFDTLSSATVDWLVTIDAEEERQNRYDFEKQMQDLLQNLQPPQPGMVAATEDSVAGVDDMMTILSRDNFAFSEMLNSAAQWPVDQEIDLQNFNFGDVGMDMTEPGVNTASYMAQ
ncbi:hypothetical protein K402DRAFT_419268 [Aulographum hederae CBS 113979]|uniref:Xylanolytic transcriptional activator regulatory domain-containing protein n=1 Tax=Aulographum hederae CBS 113979 TaxID=1176131 RepID=A0A6G1H623_9PEZI|nr:hypothetical protein K402DRAFT_419268 [Aulographum hederae CBS 113979]